MTKVIVLKNGLDDIWSTEYGNYELYYNKTIQLTKNESLKNYGIKSGEIIYYDYSYRKPRQIFVKTPISMAFFALNDLHNQRNK